MENLTPETRLEYYLDKIAAGGGSSGGGGIFEVTVTGEEDQYGNIIYTLDKNYTQITTAFDNGMLPIFIEAETLGDAYGYNIWHLSGYGYSFTSEYYVLVRTHSTITPEHRFVASEPTGVLRTQTEQ